MARDQRLSCIYLNHIKVQSMLRLAFVLSRRLKFKRVSRFLQRYQYIFLYIFILVFVIFSITCNVCTKRNGQEGTGT